MKKRLSFLVAAMAATVTTPALAQDPGKMFMINAVTPGVVSFSGEGTATFNNSSSTSNAFSVGSNTAFGVNASAASTNDYMVDSNALLQLSGASQLKQVLGTSSSAANLSEVATSALEAATASATTKADTEFGGTFSDYVAMKGGSQAEINSASTDGGLVLGDNTEFTGTIKTKSAWEQEKSGFITAQTASNFNTTNSAATQSSANDTSGKGIIGGDFVTSNNSSSSIGASAGVISDIKDRSEARADVAFGVDYDSYKLSFELVDSNDNGKIDTDIERSIADASGIKYAADTGAMFSSGAWLSAKDSFEVSEQASLIKEASSNGTSANDSTAKVTVTGVGSNAELNASDTSTFNVDIATRVRLALPENNGTANGSAGGNLATSSFANQSNTQSASAFMQAFGADAVELISNTDGELTGAKVTGRLAVQIDTVSGGSEAPVGGTSGADNVGITVLAPGS